MADLDLTAATEAAADAIEAQLGRDNIDRADWFADAAVRAAAPHIARQVRERVIAELRWADRINERAWQANTAARNPSMLIAADWLAGDYLAKSRAEHAGARREGICGDQAPTLIGTESGAGVICELSHGHRSEWHEAADDGTGLPPMRWKHATPQDEYRFDEGLGRWIPAWLADDLAGVDHD